MTPRKMVDTVGLKKVLKVEVFSTFILKKKLMQIKFQLVWLDCLSYDLHPTRTFFMHGKSPLMMNGFLSELIHVLNTQDHWTVRVL